MQDEHGMFSFIASHSGAISVDYHKELGAHSSAVRAIGS